VLLIGELLKQCERYLAEGLHPRVLVEGFEVAKKAALEFLEEFKTPMDAAVGNTDREMVRMVARTSLVSEALPCPAPSLSLSLSSLRKPAPQFLRSCTEITIAAAAEMTTLPHLHSTHGTSTARGTRGDESTVALPASRECWRLV